MFNTDTLNGRLLGLLELAYEALKFHDRGRGNAPAVNALDAPREAANEAPLDAHEDAPAPVEAHEPLPVIYRYRNWQTGRQYWADTRPWERVYQIPEDLDPLDAHAVQFLAACTFNRAAEHNPALDPDNALDLLDGYAQDLHLNDADRAALYARVTALLLDATRYGYGVRGYLDHLGVSRPLECPSQVIPDAARLYVDEVDAKTRELAEGGTR